ncbi:MAG TPA: hypothetical protein VLF62_03315 [Candidatus Saccharimonadales bacterium]|nr:hypothetical protein [Candidatus Saccharimonadales bacterium]
MPESDLDLAILTWDRSRAPATELVQRLRSALFPPDIEVDPKLAASAAGIMTGVPSSPARFIHEIGTKPQRSIGMYEAGVVDTPALRLAALAANEVILAKGGDAQRVWKDWVRPKHTRAYMGDYGRFCIKVAGALEVREAAVSSVITSEVWQERIDRFGLPKQFEEHYEAGQTWLAAQPDIPQEYAHGVALYEQVKAVVAA